MEHGNIYTIDKKDYMVIATYNNYYLLLNIMEEKDNSGDLILVEQEKKNKIKVIKDREKIRYIIVNMLNN